MRERAEGIARLMVMEQGKPLAEAKMETLAAADLIVREAGGLLTDQAGRAPRYNAPVPEQRATIAAGPKLHALILRQLAQSA